MRGSWYTTQKDGLFIHQYRIPATTGPTIFLWHHFEDVDAHTKDGTRICTNLFNPNLNIHHGLSLLELAHVGSRLKSGMLTLSTVVFIIVCTWLFLNLFAFPES